MNIKKLIALIIIVAAPTVAFAARTQSSWLFDSAGYIFPAQNTVDVLISGTNRYLNFGTFSGSSGYGFRDNSGTMEFKNSGGNWTGIGSGGGGGGSAAGTFSTTTSQVSGELVNYPNNNSDIVNIGSNSTTTAKFYFDPNIPFSFLSGVTQLAGGFLSQASSTITSAFRLPTLTQGLNYIGSTGLVNSVSTTTLTASSPLSLSQPVVKVGGSNSVLTIDTSGTWSGNAGTATALAANGTNCSAGSYPLGVDASGNSESCTVATTGTVTSVTASTPNSTLSVGGTNPVTTSGTISFDLNLAHSNTWTAIQNFFGSASSTLLSANQAWFGGTGTTTINNAGFVGIGTTTPGTDLSIGNVGGINFTSNATTTFGSSVAGINLTKGCFAVNGTCVSGSGGGGSGTVTSVTLATPNSTFTLGGTNPVTTSGTINADLNLGHSNTWTVLQSFNYSSSTLYSSFVTASTTNLVVNGSSFNNLLGTGLANSSGALTVSSVPNSALQNSTISGVSLGGTLANLTATDGTLTFSGTYTGTTARTIGVNLANANTWTALQTFTNSSTTLGSFSYSSSTQYFGANLTSCNSASNALTWSSGVFGCNTITGGGLTTYDAWTHPFVFSSATTSALSIGTTTPIGLGSFQIASNTPYLYITDNNAPLNAKHWDFTNSDGVFSIGTTSDATYTSTSTALSISAPTTASPGTTVGIATTSPWRTLDVNGTVGMKGLTGSSGLQVGILCLSSVNEVINESVACVASAKRFKENIQPLSIGLDEVLKLKPISFTWKKDFNGDLQKNPNFSGTQYSFIADDVQKIDPSLVSVETEPTTFEGINYPAGTVHGLADMNHWVALLTKAIQDFYIQFQKLVARVSGLENKLDKQQQQIDSLQTQINALKK